MSDKSKEFGTKLQNLLDSHDMTQQDLADKLYLSASTVSNYVQGTRLPRYEILKSISDYFKVSVDYLLGIEETKTKIKDIISVPNDIHKIPILGSVRAGMPTLICDENTIGYEYIDNELAKQGELFALKIKGDSMQPRMYENDIAIVKRTPDVESGSVAVVLVNGDEATVKKIIKSSNGITLIPLNNNYNPIMYSNDDIINKPVIVLGKVLEVRSKF